MTGTSPQPDRWPPIEFYRNSLVALISFIVSAAAFVIAVFLFTYCTTGVLPSAPSVCVFPHVVAATVFALGGALFLLLGGVFGALAWLSLEPERYRKLFDSLTGKASKAPSPVPSETTGEARSP